MTKGSTIIIDFTERKFYEIKTDKFASENPSKVIEQLASYYRITEAIRKKYAGPEWREDAPDWHPPHVLPFNADEDRIVCTSATEYKIGKEYLNTLNRPGLILYRVLEKQKTAAKEKRKKRAKAMRITDFAPELSPIAQRFENLLRISLVEAEDREYLIVCTWDFFEATIMRKGRENIARILSMLQVRGFDPKENPVLMLRLLGWTIVGISEFIFVAVAAGLIIPEIVGGSAPLAVAAGGPTLIDVPPSIIAGMTAANDVVALKQAAAAVSMAAAGILFLTGTAKIANAQTDKVQIDRVGMVRAIPVHSTWEVGTLATGVKLFWAGTEYFYLGRARSPI